MSVAPLPSQGSGLLTSDQLVIGPISFLDEEHPDELNFALQQAQAVHQLIGGSKQVQSLGPSPKDVTWSGRLFAGEVAVRFSQLEQLMLSAQPVSLTYLDQSATVVVKSVTKKYSHRWYGNYEITVTVLSYSNQVSTQPPTTEQQVSGISQAAQAEVNALVAQDEVGTAQVVATFNALFLAIELEGLLF